MITGAGVVTTLAGSGTVGAANGAAATAQFRYPTGVAVNGAGAAVYVADYGAQRVRRIDVAVPLLAQSGLGGTSAVAVNLAVTGLQPGTTYYPENGSGERAPPLRPGSPPLGAKFATSPPAPAQPAGRGQDPLRHQQRSQNSRPHTFPASRRRQLLRSGFQPG